MKKSVRSLLQSAMILLTLGICAKAQPILVAEIPDNSTNFVTIGSFVYFTAGDALWRTDGTEAGTILLRSGFANIGEFQEFKGMAIFVSEGGDEIWRSDGSPEGTILLKNFIGKYVRTFGQTSNYIFFRGYQEGTGAELYRTDGSPSGTILLRDINPGADFGYSGTGLVVNDYFFFPGQTKEHGIELWKSDGSFDGTTLVKDINPGPANGYFGNGLSFKHKIYFGGYTPEHGREPWVSDGTAGNTLLLTDTRQGTPGAYVSFEIVNGETLYFLTQPDLGSLPADLWKTDGSPSTTYKVKSFFQSRPFSHSFTDFLVYNEEVYFVDNFDGKQNFWRTNGTAEGTTNFISFMVGNGAVPFMRVVNNQILFYLSGEEFAGTFNRTDGTSSGTSMFAPFNSSGDDGPRAATKVNEVVFYADHTELGSPETSMENWFQLFQADGFVSTPVRDLHGGSFVGTDNILDFNGKVLFTTYNDHPQSIDHKKRLWIYDEATPADYFTLVNADTDEDIMRMIEHMTVTKSDQTNISLRYTPYKTPGSVVFNINGVTTRTENAAPFSLAGDTNGDYVPWGGAKPGAYTVTATPYTEAGGKGIAGEPLTINFRIQSDPQSSYTGTLLREVWTGVPGNSVGGVPVSEEPSDISHIPIFEAPANSGRDYGSRIRGYVIPPVSGSYVFWVASNDDSELFLSTDDQRANRRKIAHVMGATDPRQWNKYPSQRSAAIDLVGGKLYYVEVLHKQGYGTDHVAVGWHLPDGTAEMPIPGKRLSAFDPATHPVPTVRITSPSDGETITAPADITIAAEPAPGSDEAIDIVYFYEGSTAENREGFFTDTSAPYEARFLYQGPGTYTFTAKAINEHGNISETHSVTITLSDPSSGTITREYWAGVQGDRVSDIPLGTAPTSTNSLNIFEGPSNIGTNYGTRIRGYVTAPISGFYVFNISSNDQSELWLSRNEDPSQKTMIASVTGATGIREWNKYASQRSDPVMLAAGERYYIEALHKQGVGSDNIAVGWTVGGLVERPIPASRLSPFEATSETMASGLYSQISVYPNPAQSGDPELILSGYEGIQAPVETQVDIRNLTGDVMYSGTVSCGGDCDAYLMEINKVLVPGLYVVNLKTNGIKFSKRLLVK